MAETMVDTGTNRATVEAHGIQHVQCPTDALAALGFDAAQVHTVIVTHLHFDDIGNLDRFPNAHFIAPEAEMRFATGPDMQAPFIRRPYGASETSRVIDYLYQDCVTLHGETMQVASGLSVHLVGGHTAGQSIVRVPTRRGWVVLASDALRYYAEFERAIPFAVVHDMSRMLAAHRTIRALANSDAHIVPAHDPLVMQRYPAALPGLLGVVARLDLLPNHWRCPGHCQAAR